MHFNFDFSARQVLWTLEFAAQLILLVVLMGRDRMRRYPWFTTAMVLTTVRLMAEMLLVGRLAPLPYQEILLVLGDLLVFVGLLVVVEMARQAFAGAPRSMWIVNTVGLLAVSCGILAAWGPWPAFKDLAWETPLGKLRLMQLTALKGEALAAMLTVGLLILVALFGRKYKAGWRSHTQQILIGLSTSGITLLTIQATVQSIIAKAHPQTQAEYDHVVALLTRLMNATKLVHVAVLVWWIVWLWLDEPGTKQTPQDETAALPEASGE